MKNISKILLSQFKQKKHLSPKLKKLEKKISYTFKNKSILEAAITHTSHTKGQKGIFTFERMEFLGDAVLELIVSEKLFTEHPDFSEGDLSKLKSKVVSKKFLTRAANELNLIEFLNLGFATANKNDRKRNSILGNSMESLICALYLDGGMEIAHKFIDDFILINIEKYTKGQQLKNYKSLLQEYTQSKNNKVPEYRIIKEKGPEHDKFFTAEVVMDSEVWGIGKGVNKKEAHQEAAKEACEKLKL